MKRRQPERTIQAQGVALLRSLGAAVWVLGTTRRRTDYGGTMQTPGWPDVKAFLPARTGRAALALWWEAKAPGGRLRNEQAIFALHCATCGERHVTGDLDALIAALIDWGVLRRDQVPHYRTSDAVSPAKGCRA